MGNLNSKPSAGHEFRNLRGHFLDPVSGGEVCREAVAGAFYPQGVQRCSFVFGNPQITSPSMTRLKPPSFVAIYIYIYIYRPRFTRVVRGPTLVSVSLFSCVLSVKLPVCFSEKCRAPVSIPWQGPCARRTLPHHEDKMKPYSVRAETRIGISGPAYEGARTKRKT